MPTSRPQHESGSDWRHVPGDPRLAAVLRWKPLLTVMSPLIACAIPSLSTTRWARRATLMLRLSGEHPLSVWRRDYLC